MAFRPEHGIIPKDLTKTIQVVGVGLPRTGTTSFAKALEILLRAQVCHGASACLMREEAFVKKWISIFPIKPGENDEFVDNTLRDILAGYVAVVDIPGSYFPGELAHAFPNAKIICTVRDPDKWWPSMSSLINMIQRPWTPYLFWPVPTLRYWYHMAHGLATRRLIFMGPEGKDFNKDMFEQYMNAVRRAVPADRLHFFDVKDGWGPLCKILDCPIPDEPFPHINDREEIRRAWMQLERRAWLVWLGIFAVSGAVFAAGYAYVVRN